MPADAPIHNPADDLAAGRALGAGGFAAIDFETATAARASACAVGVAVVRDGDVHEVRTWLVRPPDNAYEPINIAIHGITPDMTADCPTLAEIWPDVWASIGGQPLVAHNAAFDMSVLRRSLDIHGASCPDVPYACTYQLARRVWRGRFSYRLDDLAEEGGLHLEHHHAGSDAAVAGMLGVALCGAAGERQIVDAVRSVGLVPGPSRSSGNRSTGTRRRSLTYNRRSIRFPRTARSSTKPLCLREPYRYRGTTRRRSWSTSGAASRRVCRERSTTW